MRIAALAFLLLAGCATTPKHSYVATFQVDGNAIDLKQAIEPGTAKIIRVTLPGQSCPSNAAEPMVVDIDFKAALSGKLWIGCSDNCAARTSSPSSLSLDNKIANVECHSEKALVMRVRES